MALVPTIPFDPYTNDGLGLSNWLNLFINAYISTNENTAPPPSPVTGYLWVEVSGQDLIFKIFDGSAWTVIFTLDTVTKDMVFNGSTSTGPVLSTPYYGEEVLTATDTYIPIDSANPYQTVSCTVTGAMVVDNMDPTNGVYPGNASSLTIINSPNSTGTIALPKGNNLVLNGDAILGPGKSITLTQTTDGWVEKSRS